MKFYSLDDVQPIIARAYEKLRALVDTIERPEGVTLHADDTRTTPDYRFRSGDVLLLRAGITRTYGQSGWPHVYVSWRRGHGEYARHYKVREDGSFSEKVGPLISDKLATVLRAQQVRDEAREAEERRTRDIEAALVDQFGAQAEITRDENHAIADTLIVNYRGLTFWFDAVAKDGFARFRPTTTTHGRPSRLISHHEELTVDASPAAG